MAAVPDSVLDVVVGGDIVTSEVASHSSLFMNCCSRSLLLFHPRRHLVHHSRYPVQLTRLSMHRKRC